MHLILFQWQSFQQGNGYLLHFSYLIEAPELQAYRAVYMSDPNIKDAAVVSKSCSAKGPQWSYESSCLIAQVKSSYFFLASDYLPSMPPVWGLGDEFISKTKEWHFILPTVLAVQVPKANGFNSC